MEPSLLVQPVSPSAPPFVNAAPQPSIYGDMCTQIIKEQGAILGMSLAVDQTAAVPGLKVDPLSLQCTISGDGRQVVDDLIHVYSDFFGEAAVEVCRDAAARLLSQLPPAQIPALLR